MTRLTIAAATALALTLSSAAIAQTSHGAHGAAATPASASHQQMMDDMQPKPGDTASTKAFKESDMRMMKDMNVPYTGNPDVDFRRKMIPHHQGAIDMAKVALQYAKDEDSKKLAQMIIDAQVKEIAEMQAWLKQHSK